MRAVSILIAFYLLLPQTGSSEETCLSTKTTFACVTFVKNYDGDTITVNIKDTHPLFGENISVRVAGIDTPEIRTKNKCEKDLAKKAKKIVFDKLTKAKKIDLHNVSRGKYFRILADVVADSTSIADLLIENKMAVKYDGGTKQKVDWCKNEKVAH